MRKVSELLGRAIVSAENGERIGKVADVLLDERSQQVIGLIVAGGLMRAEHVLPYSDVQTLGTDAVVARSTARVVSATKWHEQGLATRRASALKHRRVLTTGGKAIGAIQDVLLDDRGSVDAFEVVDSTLGGLIHRRSTLPYANGLTVGADAVLVPDGTAAATDTSHKAP